MSYERKIWKDYPSEETEINAESLNRMEKGIEEAINGVDELKKSHQVTEIANILYPVGSIYITTNGNFSPADVFGGVWKRWGQGRTLFGVNSADSEIDESEKTGGSKQITLTNENLPKHKHSYTPDGSIAGTVVKGSIGSTDISHTHKYSYYTNDVIGYVSPKKAKYGETTVTAMHDISETKQSRQTESGNKRHSHSFTATQHNHTFTGKKGNTDETGDAKAIDSMPPYITCFFWKRVE